ncbi:MobH family relaxase [Photorhabdus tasmaniensis]
MNFRAVFLNMQRILNIFTRRDDDVSDLMVQDAAHLSPFAQIIGDQKYTVPDHPNLEVLKFIEYPTRPAGIQTFNEQSILSLYRDKLHSISMMLAINDGDIRDDAFTFTNLVLKPLIEYVRWIHLLPASENHHHNGIGGLLSHSLEVAILSLKNAHHSELRSIGYQDEETVRRKIYLYAAFICGLVHDAGKVYDLDIVSLNLTKTITWAPSSQSLLDWARENNVVEYEIHWRKRIHNQHNIWSSVFLERILDPVCMAFLDKVKKERVYAKMVTALNIYTDGNDFLSKCVRASDFYSTGTDLNVLRDPIMGLRSNDAAARAISTIKHNFTSININNYHAKPMHIIIINGEVYLNENAFLDLVLNDFAVHKFNFPQGEAGKTVLVESLVQRGYVEPYDDERVVHYFIPGTYSENEISSIFRNGIGKLEFYNLLKLRWIGLIFDSYKIPDSVPGLFSVNANKDFIYIDEQKIATEYRRPVPGREAVTRITDTVEQVVSGTPENTLNIADLSQIDEPGIGTTDIANEADTSEINSGNGDDNTIHLAEPNTSNIADETIDSDQTEVDENEAKLVLVNQLHEMLLKAPLSNDAVYTVDSVPYLNIDVVIELLPGFEESAFCEEPYFQLTFRDGSLDGLWVVRDVNNLRLVQLGDNCAGVQVSSQTPRTTTTLKPLFDTSMYQTLVITDGPTINESVSLHKQTLELPPPRLNTPHADETVPVDHLPAKTSEPTMVSSEEYEQYDHLLEEVNIENDGRFYSDYCFSDHTLPVPAPQDGQIVASTKQTDRNGLRDPVHLFNESSDMNSDEDHAYSTTSENIVDETEAETPQIKIAESLITPPAADASEEMEVGVCPPPSTDCNKNVQTPVVTKSSHLSPALARLFAVNTQSDKSSERSQAKTPSKETAPPSKPAITKSASLRLTPEAADKGAQEEFVMISDGDANELEYVELATMLHHILTKIAVAFKRKRQNRFMVFTQNTFYLTQACVEKYGAQLTAPELFNKLPQYQVSSGAVLNTKCIAFNMPTLIAASDRAKIDLETVINNLKEAGNL